MDTQQSSAGFARRTIHPETLAGDPIAYRGAKFVAAILRGEECPSCFGGYVTITVEEDGAEHDEAVPCRRCNERRLKR